MSSSRDGAPSVEEIRVLRTVILLRHGQQDESTHGDTGLTETGFRQAALAAARLAAEPIDRIVSSALCRARQTAEAVVRHHASVEIETDMDLCECVPSVPRGQEIFYPGGVKAIDTASCREALDRAFARYFESSSDGMTLLVGHGNAFRYLICRVLDLRLDDWARFDMHNCGISRIDVKTFLGTQVTGLNDTGHLPPELLTYG